MGIRRKGRELALQLLFQLDFNHENIAEVISNFWDNHPTPVKIKEFAEGLVTGTRSKIVDIDVHIADCARNWKISRMSVVDRNILRLAVYELLFRDDIPLKVTINEALDIAKKYSSEQASKFINGVLDKIAHASLPVNKRGGRLKTPNNVT